MTFGYPEEAPPHTRGSTLTGEAGFDGEAGSPAHAGIDPRDVPLPHGSWRLPRTRGDRPPQSLPGGTRLRAPPHTRGSTWGRRADSAYGQGSPAHAGIDRTRPASSVPCSGLPRTRGDRPWYRDWRIRKTKAPPHTRGSTIGTSCWKLGSQGSPAHAGIDPIRIRF